MRSKTPLPFAEWAPDRAIISGVSSEALGVVRLGGRFVPLKTAVPLRASWSMADTAIGGAGFYDDAGRVHIFTGDRTAIYRVQDRAPVNISKIGGYNVAPDWGWVFEQFGSTIYATARGLPQIQFFTLGTSPRFNDVTTGPGYSNTLFRVREFLFSGYGKTLKSSAFNNPLDWVPDAGTQSIEVDLPHDGGDIVIGTGGQFGLVFQERKTHRIVYTGGDTVFDRDEIEEKRGALGPNAICRFGALTFFACDDGIRATDGNQSQGIGEGKIDRYFTSRLNYTARAAVSLACDVERKILYVAFPTGGSSTPNELLVYSIADGQWTRDDASYHLLFEAPRPGVSLYDDEAVTAVAGTTLVDSINLTVDSSVWRESRKQVMAVTTAREICTFEGSNRPAVMETGYGEIMPGRKAFVSEIWPLTDAATVSASVTTKLSRLSDTATNGPLSTMNAHGFCPVMAEARWMRARVEIPFATAWTEASGIDWDAEPAGEL